ncbi:aspartate/tyrosine/aromatic aminotransferase [Leucobacter sp. HY1910]
MQVNTEHAESMHATDVLIELAWRPLTAAQALAPLLTSERLNAHPHHDNSIAWLLWHAGREIDAQLAELTGGAQVWVSRGFDARFGLAVGEHEHGYGHSSAEARAIVVHDSSLLLEYLTAAVSSQVDYLNGLQDNDLSRVVDDRWEAPVTLAARMVSVSVDAAEHVAQAAYTAGMRAAAFE